MKQQYKYIATIITFILFLVIASVYYLTKENTTNPHVVEIMQDNTVLYTIDLDKIDKKQIITVNYQNHYNTIEITHGKIRILDTDCPDKICQKMNYLETVERPIICLPNHLTIRYIEDSNTNTKDKVDSYT